jgi:dGTPase
LAEALALAHDLGHPPFGHAGERALDRALAPYEGFDHNAQSLRVATWLERRYPMFNGLNLSWETLEGLVKHNGPLLDSSGRTIGPHAGGPLPYAIRAYQERQDLELDTFASLEAQAAAISDDIAYDCHDLDDGLRAGILDLDSLEDEPLTGPILRSIRIEYPRLENSRTIHELVRRVTSRMIFDVIEETYRVIERSGIGSAGDARHAGDTMVRFSAHLAGQEKTLKAFLYENLYLNPLRKPSVEEAEGVVIQLFEAFLADPSTLPEEWSRAMAKSDPFQNARRVADYIAGMTDRYAIAEHQRVCQRR